MPHFTTGTRQTNNTVAAQPQTKAISLPAVAGGQGVLNFIGGFVNNALNRRFAKNQADIAWNRELEQWHRANEYNSPQAQMARLKAAGLNPNMVYGTGTQAAGQSASSAPSAQTAKYQAQWPKLEVAEKLAQIANIEADTAATLTGEKYTGSKMEGQQSKNIVYAAQAEFATGGLLKQQLLSRIGLQNTQKDLNILKGKLVDAQTQLTSAKVDITKVGLNNSDNVILRVIGNWGAKNPTDAALILSGLIQQLNQFN